MDESMLKHLILLADKLGWTFATLYDDEGEIVGIVMGEDEHIDIMFDDSSELSEH